MACESSVIYRRRNLGTVSVAAVADLVLFDAENPRSLVYQLERLRAGPARRCRARRARRGPSGWSRRSSTRLRRLEPGRPRRGDAPTAAAPSSPTLLNGMHADLRELSGVITATHLSLPGDMQPLWGPDERRVMP